MKALAFFLLPFATLAHAQSINIDFGTPSSAPSSSHAAAGRPGVWNNFGALPSFEVKPLVGLWGQPISATLYNYGGNDLLSFDNPGTTGDDAALMDDMFISYNNPVDLCLYFEGLQNGQYEVILYGMDPDNAAHLNRVRVDNSSPGATWIGGAWPGAHQLGLTYSRHTVTVTNGKLNPHAGQYGAVYQSGLNGLQLIYLGECYANCDGVGGLTPNDFQCFINNFVAQSPMANCDHSSGTPALTGNDFQCFLDAYVAGCP